MVVPNVLAFMVDHGLPLYNTLIYFINMILSIKNELLVIFVKIRLSLLKSLLLLFSMVAIKNQFHVSQSSYSRIIQSYSSTYPSTSPLVFLFTSIPLPHSCYRALSAWGCIIHEMSPLVRRHLWKCRPIKELTAKVSKLSCCGK